MALVNTVAGEKGRSPTNQHQGAAEDVADIELLHDLWTNCSHADAVVLACPLTDATFGLLDAASLSMMPRHAVLVNVARGAVVVEDAPVAVLLERRISGAALDVFDTQPLRADHPLLALDNVLLTPHVAGLTKQSMQRMSLGTADAVRRLLAGQSRTTWSTPRLCTEVSNEDSR